MKKLLAILLAVCMIMGLALTASAAETTLPDSDGNGWWVGHTEGVEVTEEGVTVTFTNTTYATATSNWHGPLYVLYAGDEAKVNGAGYVEYWVQRGDAYGWGNMTYYGVTLPETPAEGEGLNTSWAAHMETAGITYSSTGIDGWVGWEGTAFVDALKAGAAGKVTAKLVDGKVEAVMEINGLQSTLLIPVDTNKPVYLSLFAEQAKLTNIKVTTPDPVVDEEPATSYTAELNVNWDSNPRSTATIDGPGTYTLNVDMTYWGEGAAGYAAVVIPDAYEALKDYEAALKVELGDSTVYDSEIVLNPQYVDDGTGNYVASNNCYIELYADWNATNLLESIPFGSNMVVTLTLTDPNAVEPENPVNPDPSNPKDGDSISAIAALMAVSAIGAAVIIKKKEF